MLYTTRVRQPGGSSLGSRQVSVLLASLPAQAGDWAKLGRTTLVLNNDQGSIDVKNDMACDQIMFKVSGKWIEIDNSPTGPASNDGSTGFDEYGYPTQETLWTRAEALGAFQFSRPEDVATNPDNGSEAVLASTGRENEPDLFGTADQLTVVFTGQGITFWYSSGAAPLAKLTKLFQGQVVPSQIDQGIE